MKQIEMTDVMDLLFARCASAPSPDALADIFDGLIWTMDDNGDSLCRVADQWLRGARRDRARHEMDLSARRRLRDDPRTRADRALVLDYELEIHVPSNVMHFDYFFKTEPAAVEADRRLREVIEEVYAAHRMKFAEAEPNDPSYIAVVEASFKRLTPEEIAMIPWFMSKKPHWENSNCIAVTLGGFQKEDPRHF